jgi:hypothetical protein
MTHGRLHPASLLLIAAGFVIWTSAFALLYAAQAVGCEFGTDVGRHRAIMLLIWAVHLVALLGVLVYCHRLSVDPQDEVGVFTRRVSIASTVTALLATILIGIVVPVISPCL